jgi:wobble nucleotide-excising tRNase
VIDHIQLLRNVGQFDSVTGGNQFSFSKITLLYAGNGRGKTTLAAILRSLATGDGKLITERRRLSVT